MDGASLAVLYGLGAAIGWGMGDFWAARTSKTLGPATTLLYINTLGAVLFGICYFAFLHADAHFTQAGVVYAALGGVAVTIAAAFFFKGFVAGPVSVVSTITAAYPLITALVATTIYGARLSLLQGIAICMIVGGVMIVSGLLAALKEKRLPHKGPLLGLAAVVFYGCGFVFLGRSTEAMGWQAATFVETATFIPAALIVLPFIKGKERAFAAAGQAIKNRYIIGSVLFGFAGIVSLNIGFEHEQAAGAIITAVSACYPLVTVTLALRYFKEKLQPATLFGAILTIGGVVALSVL